MEPDMRGTKNPVILTQNHADMLDRFLLQRAESSLLLLSNSRAAGLEYRGKIFQGTYAAWREGDALTGVAAHYWNGMVFFQAPENPAGLFSAVTAASGRECTGIAGPYEQVQEVLPEILRDHSRPAMNGRETLFSLNLGDLAVPRILKNGDVTCRHPSGEEIPAMTDLRIAFMRETAGSDLRESFRQEARDLVIAQQQKNNLWVLEARGTITATTAVGAEVCGMVQVGGVYTIPGHRGRGYGRAVVAGSLIEARARGATKAILFTGTDMPAAQKMYRALGFRPIGEYGLVII
jgi:GNAT superfamily N-acetyltransferase